MTDLSKDLFDDKGRPIIVLSSAVGGSAGRVYAKVVAGSDALAVIKSGADDTLTGTADQTKLNADLVAATGGNVVVIGTIYTTATITVPTGTTLDLTNARISSQPGYREVTPVGTAKVIGGAVYTLPYPFVIAKMMGGAIAPDNTMESLKCSMATPVDAIECDALVLADKSLAVMHNSTLNGITTATGSSDIMTAPSWQQLVMLVTGSGGGEAAGIYDLIGGSDDAWGGTYHPPMLTDVMGYINGKKVLVVDYKNNGALTPLMALINSMGLKDSMIICDSVDDGSQLSPATAAGFTCLAGWAGTTGDGDIAAQFAAMKALGIKFVYLLYPSKTTKTVIDLAHAAGLRVCVGSMNRYSDWKYITDLAATLGVEGVFTADPYYALGFVQGNYDYRRTTDPFAANTWYHGMPGVATYNRGYFTAGRFGFKQETAARSMVLQGWGCPIATPTAYTLHFKVKFDQIDSDTSRWAGIFFGAPTDMPAIGAGGPSLGESGYCAMLRANGEFDIYKYVDGNETLAGYFMTTEITVPGTEVEITIQVTATQIIFTRIDIAGSTTITDNSYRGPYFHFGEAISGGGTKGHYTFKTVSIT
jgi:glycerophosphoryl diester phosphodiesterase